MSATKFIRRDTKASVVFLLPSFIGFMIFILMPIAASVVLGFFKWHILSPPEFIGLKNFAELFTDRTFGRVAINTFVYTFGSIPIVLALSLIVANLLADKIIPGQNTFRTIFFLPHVVSAVGIGVIWSALLQTDNGWINSLFELINMPPVPWLTSSTWALPSVIGVTVWKRVGYFMILYVAALKAIPSNYFEAAEMDGANRLQIFWHIKVPLVSPTTFFASITAIISSFQVFGLTSVMTKGGPGLATTTTVMDIYATAFTEFRMGYASAQSFLLFLVLLGITIIQKQASKRWVYEA